MCARGLCWMAVLLAACGERGDAEPHASPSLPPAEQVAASAMMPTAAPAPSVDAALTKARAERRGLWIWEFGKNAPPPEGAAEIALEVGAARVFVKASNGNAGKRWADNASAQNLAPFLQRGLEVWVFGYFYGEGVADADGRTWGSLEEQAESILPSALLPGVTGVVVDAEQEFFGRPEDARKLCKLLRARLGPRKLAYTSYGWPSAAPRFPFKAFDEHCGDAFLPQVYYAFGWPEGPTGSLERLHRQARALGLRAPIWPVQSNERNPSVSDMSAFFASAGPDASVFYLHPAQSPQTVRLREVKLFAPKTE